MNKEEVINKAQDYSKNVLIQKDYIAGFQAACNIIRQKLEICYNDEFCDEMERLAEVAEIEFDKYL